jgi:hypothetical protein
MSSSATSDATDAAPNVHATRVHASAQPLGGSVAGAVTAATVDSLERRSRPPG